MTEPKKKPGPKPGTRRTGTSAANSAAKDEPAQAETEAADTAAQGRPEGVKADAAADTAQDTPLAEPGETHPTADSDEPTTTAAPELEDTADEVAPELAANSAPIVPPAEVEQDENGPKYKLGKLPPRPGAVTAKLSDFVDVEAMLPKIPLELGHENLLPADIGMLGNDTVGDCVWAGAAHETMLWNLEAGRQVNFTPHSVLSDYSRVTGYNPQDPDSDRGTNMADAAKYRRKTGVLDGSGGRHKVAAYLALETGNLDELAAAAYLFGAVGIGIEVPESAQEQFNAGEPWDVVKGSPIEGGHYVPLVGRIDKNTWVVLTWGRAQKVTSRFLKKYNDESIAYVSVEALSRGKSLEGFDQVKLEQFLTTVSRAS